MVELSPAHSVPDLLRLKSVSALHAKNISGPKICFKWGPNSSITISNETNHSKNYMTRNL